MRYLTSQSIISFSLHSHITHTPYTIVDPVIIPRKDGDWNNGNKRIMLTWFCSFWYGVVENPQQKPEVYQLSYFNTRLFYIESIYYTRQKIFLVLTSTYNGHWKIIQLSLFFNLWKGLKELRCWRYAKTLWVNDSKSNDSALPNNVKFVNSICDIWNSF